MKDKDGNDILSGDRFYYTGSCEKGTMRKVEGEGDVIFWDDGEITWVHSFYDRSTSKELEKI